MKQPSMSRWKFVQRSASAVLAAPFVLQHQYRLFADSQEEYLLGAGSGAVREVRMAPNFR